MQVIEGILCVMLWAIHSISICEKLLYLFFVSNSISGHHHHPSNSHDKGRPSFISLECNLHDMIWPSFACGLYSCGVPMWLGHAPIPVPITGLHYMCVLLHLWTFYPYCMIKTCHVGVFKLMPAQCRCVAIYTAMEILL